MMKKIILILIMLTLSFAAIAAEKPVEQKKREWRDEDYAGRYYDIRYHGPINEDTIPDLAIEQIPDGFKITVLDSFYYLCKIDEVIVEYFENLPSEKLILKCGIFVWDGVLDGNTYIELSMGHQEDYLSLSLTLDEDKNCLMTRGCVGVPDAFKDPTR